MADTTRKLNIWINDKQVEYSFKSISNAIRLARNELAKAEIGSKEYIEQTKKIKQLNAVLDDHKKLQGQIASGWQKTKAQIATIAAGNFLSDAFTSIGSTITNEFSKAMTKIKEFATGISELKAITGLSGEGLEKLKKNAIDLAAEFGTSAKDIVEGMKLVGSARPELLSNAEALSEMTRQTLILSKASGMDMAQSTQALAGALNQFNEPASKAGEYINILAAAAKNGVQEIPFLSDFVLRSGKIAKDANLSFSDLATAGELLGVSFKSPELASSGLNRVLLNLQKEGLGYGSGKFSLADALKDVQNNLNGMNDESQKASYQNKVFGEGLTVGKVLLENNVKDLETNITKFDKFKNSIEGTNEAMKQANDRMDNWQGDLDKAGGAWDKFLLSLDSGNGVITQLTRGFTQMFTGFLTDIGNANDSSLTFVERTMGWIDTLARANPALFAFNEKIKDFFGLNEKLAKIKFSRDLADAKERGVKAAQEEIKAREEEKKKQSEKSSTKSTTVLSNDDKNSIKLKAQAEAKRLEDERIRQMDKFKQAYASMNREINAINREANRENLSDEQKQLEEISYKYGQQLEITQQFIDELEKKQKSKAGLLDDEKAILNNFYNQRAELVSLRDGEIIDKMEEFEKKKEEILKKAAESFKIAMGAGAEEAGKTPERKDKLEKATEDLEKYIQYANIAKDALGALFEIQSNKQAAELSDFEKANQKKKDLLDARLKKGLISEDSYNKQVIELDKKLENQKKKFEIAEAKRNKTMRLFEAILNTAASVTRVLWNPPLAIAVGALGAIQIAAIAAQPIPKAAKGMRVNSPTLLQAGEAGPEIVLSNKIVGSKSLGPIADDLARIQEGKQPRFLGQPNMPNFNGMNSAIGRNPVSSIQNNNTVINQVDNKSIDEMRQTMEAMNQLMINQTEELKKIKYLRAIITNDDLKENDKDEEIRMRYSSF